MRISVLCSGSGVFGMEIVTLILARRLRSLGHEIEFLVSAWNDGDFVRRLATEGLPAEAIRLGKISKSLRPRSIKWTLDALVHLPGARRAVRSHFRRFRPDVVIVSHRDWVLLIESLLREQRTVFHVHELDPVSAWSSRVYRRINETVSACVAVSEHIAARLTELGVSPAKTHVVRNGVEIDETTKVVEHRAKSSPNIGIVGQVGSWKGHDDLVEALRVLNAEREQFSCSIFGRGDDRYVADLKAKAREGGVAESISWHGYVRETATIYRDMDVCVVPSRFDDPFPTVAIEAGLRGIPVVATRRGGLPEIIVDGETGFLVSPGDTKALAARLRDLIRDPALRTRFGEAAHRRISDNFTAARMARNMEMVLEDVLGTATNRAAGSRCSTAEPLVTGA